MSREVSRLLNLNMAALAGLLLAAAATSAAAENTTPYLGATDAVVLAPPGCNATAFVQVPGAADLFIGRQLITETGALAGVSGPNDCSGGNAANEKAGKPFNRWSLVLDRLDWTKHAFSIVKPLLDTSLDPHAKISRAAITSGPMRGAIVRSAYDASIVTYQRAILVAFECTIENDSRFGVDGTSACLSVYDPLKQSLDMSRTAVIISGNHDHDGRFHAAAVPELLVVEDRLFVYWSALTVVQGKFAGIEVRGAELAWSPSGVTVKGSGGRVVHASDEPLTTRVWAPDPADKMANTTVDIRVAWANKRAVTAMAPFPDVSASPSPMPASRSHRTSSPTHRRSPTRGCRPTRRNTPVRSSTAPATSGSSATTSGRETRGPRNARFPAAISGRSIRRIPCW
jgi:hypothetical protein